MAKKSVWKIIRRKFRSASIRCAHLFDAGKDRKICGCSLVRYVPSLYRETMGATGSESTCYWALEQIFDGESFSEADSFIDVGCGKGRVLAYLQSKGVPCKLTGIELNRDVAAFAQKWTERYSGITVLNGNAFELDYNAYTVMFLGRPFETEAFCRFIDRLEENQHRKIRVIYWWDTQSGSYLENRTGWNMIRRGVVFKSHGLYMYHYPQRFTVWEYTPDEK